MDAEGWYLDPYKIHEARWFSDGTPTKLVKDGEVVSDDPPPDALFVGDIIELQEIPSHPDDMLRVDRPEKWFDRLAQVDAAFEVAGQIPSAG